MVAETLRSRLCSRSEQCTFHVVICPTHTAENVAVGRVVDDAGERREGGREGGKGGGKYASFLFF